MINGSISLIWGDLALMPIEFQFFFLLLEGVHGQNFMSSRAQFDKRIVSGASGIEWWMRLTRV